MREKIMKHRRQKYCSPNPIRSARPLLVLTLSLLLAACGGGSNNNTGGSDSGSMSGSGSGNSGGNNDGSGGNNDHSDTPDGATTISLDSAISGRIDSATDVDHFRLGIESEGTLTIRTSGNADPDIRVYDAGGVEIPGMAGSWIVVIDQSILDKGNYVIVRLSGGTPGESYSTVASFRIDDSDMGGDTAPPPIHAIPATFREGSITPVYAQDAGDTVDSMKGMPFPALGTAIRRVWIDTDGQPGSDDGTTSLSTRAHVSTITEHPNGGATAVFMADEERYEINFPPGRHNATWPESNITRESHVVSMEADSLNSNNNPLNEDYYSFGFWSFYPGMLVRDGEKKFRESSGYGYDGQIVYGARTGADLPMGAASYAGNFFGRFHSTTGNPSWTPDDSGESEYWSPGVLANRRALWGRIHLEANLADLTISGNVDTLWMESARTLDNNNQIVDGEWSELPDTTSIAISEGSIAGGRFVTTWTGRDTDPGNPAETSVRGFSGHIVGDFYGPNAEEAAGLFNGSRGATSTTPSQVIWGTFGAEKDE